MDYSHRFIPALRACLESSARCRDSMYAQEFQRRAAVLVENSNGTGFVAADYKRALLLRLTFAHRF
jgi:hypothetical protein